MAKLTTAQRERKLSRMIPEVKPKDPTGLSAVMSRATDGKGVALTKDQGTELFIGGITGLMQLADKLGLSASTGGALVLALETAMPKLSIDGLIAAYERMGGEMPSRIGAKILAATRRKRPPPPRQRAR